MNGGLDFANVVSNASPVFLIAMLVVALLRGWLLLPSALLELEKRLADRDSRVTELLAERDEFKRMAYAALDIGERITTATESRERR